MQRSPNPAPAPAPGEGQYTVVLPGGGHRTLEVTKAGPDFRAGTLSGLPSAPGMAELDQALEQLAYRHTLVADPYVAQTRAANLGSGLSRHNLVDGSAMVLAPGLRSSKSLFTERTSQWQGNDS